MLRRFQRLRDVQNQQTNESAEALQADLLWYCQVTYIVRIMILLFK